MKPGLRPIDAVLIPLWVGGMVWLAIVGKWTAFIIITLAVPGALAFDIFWLSPRLSKRRASDNGRSL
jgi:hypothetical protein